MSTCEGVHADPLCGCYTGRPHACGPGRCRLCPVGRVETLVAVEWDDRHLGLDTLVDRLRSFAGDDTAVIEVTTSLRSDERKEHRVKLDTGLIRNTNAHGISYRCGFVSHIES